MKKIKYAFLLLAFGLAIFQGASVAIAAQYKAKELYQAGGKNHRDLEESFLTRTRLIQQKNLLEILDGQELSSRRVDAHELGAGTKESSETESVLQLQQESDSLEPVLVESINALDYVNSSGKVSDRDAGVVVMDSNGSVSYVFYAESSDDYQVSLSTIQLVKKNTPPGYEFNFNIYVDGSIVTNVNLAATGEFTASDLIDLGSLGQGEHEVKFEWINYIKNKKIHTKLGIKNIEIYKDPAEPLPFFNLEATATIEDPTPDGGGYFGNISLGTSTLLMLNDNNEGANRVFQVFDHQADSATFGQWLGTIEAPEGVTNFGESRLYGEEIYLMSSINSSGNIVYQGYNIDRNSSNFLNLVVSLEDPTPDGYFGNDFRSSSRIGPFKQMFIRNSDNSGAVEYNIFDLDPNSATFGQMVGTLTDPITGNNALYLDNFFSDGRTFFNSTDADGERVKHLFDADPASATYGELILTVSDPDSDSSNSFGSQYSYADSGYLIMSDENDLSDTFYHVIDINRSSPTFGEFVATIANPDPVAGDDFGRFFRVINGLFLVGDNDGFGNGSAHAFDFNASSSTFGELVETFDFPLAPDFGFINLFGRGDILFESESIFSGSGFGTPEIHLYDLNPLSPTFGELLTTLEDPSSLAMSMSGFPYFSGINAIFLELEDINFNLYAYDIDPLSPTFGELVSTMTLLSPLSGYSVSFSGSDFVIRFGLSMFQVSVNPS